MITLHPIDRAATGRHQPDAPDDRYWQESFFIGWNDARNRCGGHHHISLCPFLGRAHVWSWIALDGAVICRVQEHALALPSDDLRDMRLGPLHFTAGDGLRSLRLHGDFGGTRLELDYTSFYDPLEIGLDGGGTSLGARHYESMGRVLGALEVAGRRIVVDGVAWHDHSWGTRKFSSNPAGRWLFAVFGDDFAVSAFCLGTPTASRQFGYIWHGGTATPLVEVVFRMVIDDTEITPAGCDATLTAADGRCYRVRGEVDARSISGGPGWSDGGEWWGFDGLARFECGDRLGAGFLEVFDFGASRSRREELGLPWN